MTLSQRPFRRMAWLAMAAALLMAVMPTASRVAAVGGAGDGGLIELCTAAGLKLVSIASFGVEAPDAPPSAPSPMSAAACGYCVLPAALAVVLLLLLMSHQRLASFQTWRWQSPLLRPPRNAHGLGAQGPPLPL